MKKFLGCLAMVAMFSGTALAGEILVEGGAPAIEKVLKPVQEAFEKSSGHKLKMLASGPKIALMNLDQGKIGAAIGPAFDDWMVFMNKEGAPVADPGVYQKVVVGEDRVITIVNKENPITALSKEQLAGIFSGKIDNWQQVGGTDTPVMVVSGQLIMPAVNIFYSKIMPGMEPVKDQLLVSTAAEVRQTVAANKEAIGIVSYKIVDGTVKAPEVPNVPIIFTLVTKGVPSPEVQALIDFLKKK
ncbi:MAG: phosphate ABC transporter substrate-binding protein [Desulfobulbaceae bacterium]|nr:phosphate ABC transporter substrate-binding protein [Desulfobulbaceae bacterium]